MVPERFQTVIITLIWHQTPQYVFGFEVFAEDHLHLGTELSSFLLVEPGWVQKLNHIVKAGVIDFKAAFVHSCFQLGHGDDVVAEVPK